MNLMELIDNMGGYYYGSDSYKQARAAVVEAVEKLDRDAARYRWLRNRVFKDGDDLLVEIQGGYDVFGMDFDAAIDAAMEATNGQGN